MSDQRVSAGWQWAAGVVGTTFAFLVGWLLSLLTDDVVIAGACGVVIGAVCMSHLARANTRAAVERDRRRFRDEERARIIEILEREIDD